MDISTSINVLFGVGTVTEQLERVRRAGFRNMDICFNDWSGDSEPRPWSPYVQDGWREWVGGIKEFGAVNAITFNQAHAPIYNIFDEDERGQRLAMMSLRTVEAAGMLGIPWVVFHAGTRPGPYLRADRQRLKEDNLRRFEKIIGKAAQCGTGIAIENMADRFGRDGKPGCYCADTEDLIELVDAFHDPRVGICWDTGHAHMQKTDQYRDILLIGGRLKALHIQDSDGMRDQHTAPFYGTIDWDIVAKALRGAQYKGWLTFEAHNLIRPLPDACKDDALRLLYSIGETLAGMIEKQD